MIFSRCDQENSESGMGMAMKYADIKRQFQEWHLIINQAHSSLETNQKGSQQKKNFHQLYKESVENLIRKPPPLPKKWLISDQRILNENFFLR